MISHRTMRYSFCEKIRSTSTSHASSLVIWSDWHSCFQILERVGSIDVKYRVPSKTLPTRRPLLSRKRIRKQPYCRQIPGRDECTVQITLPRDSSLRKGQASPDFADVIKNRSRLSGSSDTVRSSPVGIKPIRNVPSPICSRIPIISPIEPQHSPHNWHKNAMIIPVVIPVVCREL